MSDQFESFERRRYEKDVTKLVQIIAMAIKAAHGLKPTPRPKHADAMAMIAEWIASGEPLPPISGYRHVGAKILRRVVRYERQTLHVIRPEWEMVKSAIDGRPFGPKTNDPSYVT